MEPSTGPRTVICGVDESREAAEAARVAHRLASSLGLRLLLVHAVRDLMVPRPPPIGVNYPPGMLDELRAGSLAAGERLMGDVVASLPPGDHGRHVAIGTPASVLLDLARDQEAAYLVLGSRGLGGMARMVLGSVSRAVLAAARCPVVIVPPGWTVDD